MSGIPPELHNRLRQALLQCGPFGSDGQLRAIFADQRISPWRDSLPEAGSTAGRVEATIDLMLGRWSGSDGQNALVLLLHVLGERTDPGDACHGHLLSLADETEAILGPDGGKLDEGRLPDRTLLSADQASHTGSSAFELNSVQPHPVRLSVFDASSHCWSHQCEFLIPRAEGDQKLAYQVSFRLRLENGGPTPIREPVIELYPTSSTDFFLQYDYRGASLVITDSPREWRVSETYRFCEFEGSADFVCHGNGYRHLGVVQMLVPYGQPDTTMTFRYRIQAEEWNCAGSFAIVLRSCQ